MGKKAILATAYHNLSTMLDAGLSILRSIDIISEGLQGNFKKVFLGTRDSISKGEGISESMKQYRRIFSDVDIMLVEAAEKSGKFPECFKLLSNWYEFRIHIMRLLIKGFALPLLIIHFLIILLPLPRVIMGMMTLDKYAQHVFGILFFLYFSIITLIFIFRMMRKAQFLRSTLDHLTLMIPVLGTGVWELSISRFSHAFNMLFKAGVPIIESLDLAPGLAGNTVVAKIFEGGSKSTQAGNPAHKGFSKRLPSEYMNLWQIGEETGELSKTVDKIAEISGDRAELYFSEFATWFPRIIYFLILIGMAMAVISGYMNLYSMQGL